MKLKSNTIVVGILILAFLVWALPDLYSGFIVEREDTVGPKRFSLPGTLIQTSDRGYLVVGNESDNAWATKTDSNGKALWTFEEPAPGRTGAHFLTAAASADGGVLICGRRDSLGERGYGRSGFVIRLDKDGHEINRIDPYLQNPNQLTDVFSCSKWGKDFAVVGVALQQDKEGKSSIAAPVRSLLRLRDDGTLVWQKTVRLQHGSFGEITRGMPDGSLVVAGLDGITRIDNEGVVREQVDIKAGSTWITSYPPDNNLKFVINGDKMNDQSKIIELNSELKIINEAPFSLPDNIRPQRIYSISDGTMIVLSNTSSIFRKFIPTISEISKNFKIDAQYKFADSRESEVFDFLLVEETNEIVVVRAVFDGNKTQAKIDFLKRREW